MKQGLKSDLHSQSGADPLRKPGYRVRLDRHNDDIACEYAACARYSAQAPGSYD